MDGAALRDEEMTLLMFGFTKAEKVSGAIHIAALELRRSEVEKAGGLTKVLLGQVDVAPDVTTASAPALARKLHALHVGQDNLKSASCAGGSDRFILVSKVPRAKQ